MEAIFYDIASALREPRQDVWRPVRAFALDYRPELHQFTLLLMTARWGVAVRCDCHLFVDQRLELPAFSHPADIELRQSIRQAGRTKELGMWR
ncbi:hypothetical protein NKI98_17925 [Mesorhizobium sp. M0222]|uniref:hypothetical protein n=1 Tax=Mesorhizobium sp. M0222 TaxID=2956921 RepID=UPI0033386958